jgi:hypothetical protein
MLDKTIARMSLELFSRSLFEAPLIELIGILSAVHIATETGDPEFALRPPHGGVGEEGQQ